MKYPKSPPATDASVATSAISYARERFANIIGSIRTSGGMGKTELSTKATTARTQSAARLSAMESVQS